MKFAEYLAFNVVWMASVYYWRWKMVKAEEKAGYQVVWMLGWAKPTTADGIRYRKYSILCAIGGIVAFLAIFPSL